MTKPTVKINDLTRSIERLLIRSGADGMPAHKLMEATKVGRTCLENHLRALTTAKRIYRVRRTIPGKNAIYHTYHANSKHEPAVEAARRDPLVAYLFGEAK